MSVKIAPTMIHQNYQTQNKSPNRSFSANNLAEINDTVSFSHNQKQLGFKKGFLGELLDRFKLPEATQEDLDNLTDELINYMMLPNKEYSKLDDEDFEIKWNQYSHKLKPKHKQRIIKAAEKREEEFGRGDINAFQELVNEYKKDIEKFKAHANQAQKDLDELEKEN